MIGYIFDVKFLNPKEPELQADGTLRESREGGMCVIVDEAQASELAKKLGVEYNVPITTSWIELTVMKVEKKE